MLEPSRERESAVALAEKLALNAYGDKKNIMAAPQRGLYDLRFPEGLRKHMSVTGEIDQDRRIVFWTQELHQAKFNPQRLIEGILSAQHAERDGAGQTLTVSYPAEKKHGRLRRLDLEMLPQDAVMALLASAEALALDDEVLLEAVDAYIAKRENLFRLLKIHGRDMPDLRKKGDLHRDDAIQAIKAELIHVLAEKHQRPSLITDQHPVVEDELLALPERAERLSQSPVETGPEPEETYVIKLMHGYFKKRDGTALTDAEWERMSNDERVHHLIAFKTLLRSRFMPNQLFRNPVAEAMIVHAEGAIEHVIERLLDQHEERKSAS